MTHRHPAATLAAVFILLVVSVARNASAQTGTYREDFEDPALAGWDLERGWQVVTQDDNRALQGEGHAWARPDVQFDGDFRLSLRLRLVRGRIHLVYHLNDIGRYFIGFEASGSDLNRQEWPDTFHENLASSSSSHALSTWHQIEIRGQAGRLEFIVDGRTEWQYTDPSPLSGGSFALETLEDSSAQIDDVVADAQLVQAATPLAGDTASLVWVRTGGPLGGLGYDVRMDPANPDHMWVTDAFAGVFRSLDGGQTWTPSNEGILTRTGPSGDAIPVFCLTVDPHDPSIVWAGTQFQRGIFRSSDGGLTWERRDRGIVERDGITFRGLTVDPRSSDTVYAAAEISSWADGAAPRDGREFDMTRGVVYRTDDAGLHWRAIWRGDNLARYIWVNPEDPDVIYVSTGIFDREAANSDPQAATPGGEGVLRSTDGGQTWSSANTGLGNLYVGSLFMSPSDPDVLLAATGNNQYFSGAGVYLSTDGGDSWRRTLRLEEAPFESVEFSLADPQIAYAASDRAVFRSEDGGSTWERVTGSQTGWGPPGVRAGFPIDLQVDPRDTDRLFANAYGGGNFLSTDGGRTWSIASAGYTGAQVRAIAVDPADAARVFAAARSGIFISTDAGATWEGHSFPPAASLEWTAVAIDPAESDHILAATNWEGYLLESTDGGLTWHVVLIAPGARMGWRAIAFAPSDPATVYAGSGGFFSAGSWDNALPAAGIYRSDDGGFTWTEANDELSADAHVAALAVDDNDPLRLYAASTNRGLLRSTDGGRSWSSIDRGLPGSPPQALAIAIQPGQPDTLFVGLWQAGIYRTTDGGETWRVSSAGMPVEASVQAVCADPLRPGILYASDLGSGVYRSSDGGSTWHVLNQGLRTRAVNAMALSSEGQHLYAATEGEGVFRLDLNGTPPQGRPAAAPTPTASPTQDEAPAAEVAPATGSSPTTSPTRPEAAAARADTNWLLVGLSLGGAGLVALAVLLVRRRRASPGPGAVSREDRR